GRVVPRAGPGLRAAREARAGGGWSLFGAGRRVSEQAEASRATPASRAASGRAWRRWGIGTVPVAGGRGGGGRGGAPARLRGPAYRPGNREPLGNRRAATDLGGRWGPGGRRDPGLAATGLVRVRAPGAGTAGPGCGCAPTVPAPPPGP